MKKCQGKTKRGRRCPNAAGESGYCFTHDPRRAKERASARKLGGFRRRRSAESGEPIVIRSSADVLNLINLVIADITKLDNSPARGRVLLAAAATANSTLETGELENRIATIERQLREIGKGRGHGETLGKS